MRFEHLTPTRIVFGRGRFAELGVLAAQYGRRALLVCGRRAMRRLGVLQRASELLSAADVATVVFDRISVNPRSDELDAGAALAREKNVDLVIGIGGGSAIDAAKGIAVGLPYPKIGSVIGKTLPSNAAALPIIAVPTTAGTGSEVSKGAIVIDTERQFKSGIRGNALFPKMALIDPALSESQPREVALETGFDAFTHALESYIARQATPISRALSEAILPRLHAAIKRLAEGTADAGDRDDLALAATIGGLNVATASTCLPHRLQQAMGSLLRVPLSHPRGLALVYPAWLERVKTAASGDFARLGALLGVSDFSAAVIDLLRAVGMKTTLREAGYGRDDIDFFIANISGNVENDPMPRVGASVVREIYEEVY